MVKPWGRVTETVAVCICVSIYVEIAKKIVGFYGVFIWSDKELNRRNTVKQVHIGTND